jgi:hypothetical protein
VYIYIYIYILYTAVVAQRTALAQRRALANSGCRSAQGALHSGCPLSARRYSKQRLPAPYMYIAVVRSAQGASRQRLPAPYMYIAVARSAQGASKERLPAPYMYIAGVRSAQCASKQRLPAPYMFIAVVRSAQGASKQRCPLLICICEGEYLFFVIEPGSSVCARAMSKAFQARCTAAAMALRGAAPHLIAPISRIQTKAVLEMIGREKPCWSAEAAATALDYVSRVTWVSGDLDLLLAALEPKDVKSAATRRHAQDFRRIFDTFPESKWSVLSNPNVGMTGKRDMIMMHAIDLGAILPSEPTFKLFNSMAIVLSCLAQDAMSMSTPQKSALKDSVKSEWKRMTRSLKHRDGDAWIETLPAIEEYKELYPSRYARVYANGPPQACPHDVQRKLFEFEATYRCRGGGSDMPTYHLATMQALPPPPSSAGLFSNIAPQGPSSQLDLVRAVMEGMAALVNRDRTDTPHINFKDMRKPANVRKQPTLYFDEVVPRGGVLEDVGDGDARHRPVLNI